MATKIVTKNSSTASAVPTASDLVQGELAVNVADKRLFTEDNGGSIVELGTNPSGNVTFQDNGKAIFGAGSDLQIYHNGNHSFISEAGTGDLFIRSSDISIQDETNAAMIDAIGQGAVKLYFDKVNNASPKLTTTSTGIDVTGTATTDGLTVDGTSQLGTVSIYDSGTNATVAADSGHDLEVRGRAGQSVNIFSNGTKTATFDSVGDISFYEDTGTTPKLVWDASAESLGVGQAPTSALHVINSTASGESIATLEASATKNGYVYINGDDNRRKSLVFQSGGVDKFSMGVGDSDELSASSFFIGSGKHGGSAADLVIDSSGNVGIGTSSPSFSGFGTSTSGIDIVNSNNAALRLSGNAADAMFFVSGSSKHWLYGKGAVPMAFSTNSTERMRIDASGNVGVGTASPAKPLHINSGTGNVVIRCESSDTEAEIEFKDNNTGSSTPRVGGVGNDLFLQTGGAERLRIDASGNVLVGKSGTNFNAAGIELHSADQIYSTSTTHGLAVNRLSTDGDIAKFYKDGTTVGSIGVNTARPYFAQSGNMGIACSGVSLLPTDGNGLVNDNTNDIGFSSLRWQDIYATNGTIQTSDRNEKQDIAELTDAEQRVAVAAKGLLRKFRWKDSVAEKGDEARIHFGIIAQDLQAAFAAEGLDAGDYAMFISTTWTDEETNEEKTRMGVRYSELLAFIIAAL